MNRKKLLRRLAQGVVQNVPFDDFRGLVQSFGFSLARVSGSHHIFVHGELSELLNLQNVGGEAKPYQIRQFLRLVERYNLIMEDSP
jgi:predicted RNA binding protein YcfA (HicA-like mRNA interferase family)